MQNGLVGRRLLELFSGTSYANIQLQLSCIKCVCLRVCVFFYQNVLLAYKLFFIAPITIK